MQVSMVDGLADSGGCEKGQGEEKYAQHDFRLMINIKDFGCL